MDAAQFADELQAVLDPGKCGHGLADLPMCDPGQVRDGRGGHGAFQIVDTAQRNFSRGHERRLV